MLRVALINPPNSSALGYESENSLPPLGLAYIASTLREKGFWADLFDLGDVVEPSDEFLRSCDFFDYQLYGFTAYTKTFRAMLDLIACLRRQRPDAVVVIGGPHATPCAEQILRTEPNVDLIIRNEGEVPTAQLASFLAKGTPDIKDVNGLVYREGGLAYRFQGRSADLTQAIRTNADQELVELDRLPLPARDYKIEPNREVLEERGGKRPVRTAFISSARGCPKRCSFCSIIVMSPKYRTRSVSSLMNEIIELHKQDAFGHIDFLDPNTLADFRRSLEFSRELYAWNPGVTWSGTATADTIAAHESVINEIGSLNCLFLEVGIESGSDSVLRRFNKRTTVAQNLRTLQILERAGIDIELDFIMFDPETTLHEIQENMTFLKLGGFMGAYPMEHLYNTLKVYPGTPAREHYRKMFCFQDDASLPTVMPFVDQKVRMIHNTIKELVTRYHGRLSRVLVGLDRLHRRIVANPSSCLRESWLPREIAAAIIRLRHAPYTFFEALVQMASSGEIPAGASFEDLTTTPAFVLFLRRLRHAETILDQVADDYSARATNMVQSTAVMK